MNFKAYDILATLVPGFIFQMVMLSVLKMDYNKDYIIPYTASAFLLGYILNTLSSWLEDFYYFTWGGKPSSLLLQGKNIWKVRFYEFEKAKALLIEDSSIDNPNDDQLFAIAARTINGNVNSRVSDFNSNYAFARAILTTMLIATIILIINNHDDYLYYLTLFPILFITWLRCKQRAFYYSKEVLNEYMKTKT